MNQSQKYGLRVVRWSPLFLLASLSFVFLARSFASFTIAYTLSLLCLGFVITPLLIANYKTGNKAYAAYYGGAFGLGIGLSHIANPGFLEKPIWVCALYSVAMCFAGIFLIFSILRNFLQKYLGQNTAK